MSEVLRLENVSRRYKEGEGQLEVFRDLNLSLEAGRDRGAGGPVRRGQVLAAAYGGPAGSAVQRRDLYRRRGGLAAARAGAHPHPPRHHRLRLSGPSSAAGIRRAGECGDAADDRGQAAPRRREEAKRAADRAGPGRAADAPAGATVGRRAAARRHRPRPGQQARAFFWPTSRPAISIRAPRAGCSTP